MVATLKRYSWMYRRCESAISGGKGPAAQRAEKMKEEMKMAAVT